jgi:hypothetical protein
MTLKGAVFDRLPPRLRYEIAARRGRSWIRDIDLDALEEFDHAEGLEDPQALEEFLPRLGINDDSPEFMPKQLGGALGKGLKVWQYPCQFAPYLALVGRKPIRSYLEIGVAHGGSFIATVEYLRHLGHPIKRAVAVDILWAPGVARYVRSRPYAEQVIADTASPRFQALARSETWDLVFIDGDHSFEGCLRDFESVHGHAKAIAFHDIVDSLAVEVREVWNLVRADYDDEYEFIEFVAQYPDVPETGLGIGVAARR